MNAMLKRVFMLLVLPLLLILAQQGAVTHEISHHAELAPLSQQKHQSPHPSVCDKCVAYGEMAGTLNATSFNLPVIKTVDTQIDSYQASSFYFSSSGYLARAPPSLS